MAKWQNKNKNKSKMGKKDLNPTDSFRKKLRDKEKRRNKIERKTVREEALLRKNPKLIEEELEKLNHLSLLGQLGTSGSKRREKLEVMLEFTKSKLLAEKRAKDAKIEDFCIGVPTNRVGKSGGGTAVETSESSSFSGSESDESDDEEDEDAPLASAPPLPPGPPPPIALLTQNIPSSFQDTIPSLPKTQTIPTDFTQLQNWVTPIVPPPPPSITSDATNEMNDYALTTAPPLPRGPPPSSMLPIRPPMEGKDTNEAPLQHPMIRHPGGMMGPLHPSVGLPQLNYNIAYMPPNPVYFPPPPFGGPPYMETGPYQPMVAPVVRVPMNPTAPLFGGTIRYGGDNKPSTSTTPPSTTPAAPLETSNSSPQPPPTVSAPRALFVPTQLRVRNKETQRSKYNSHKVSSINQVTAFSTGIQRADNPPLTELKTLDSYIGSTTQSGGNTKNGVGLTSSQQQKDNQDLDQAFNDFLKEVERA